MMLRLNKWIGGTSTEQTHQGGLILIRASDVCSISAPLGAAYGFGSLIDLSTPFGSVVTVHVQQEPEQIATLMGEGQYPPPPSLDMGIQRVY